MKRLLICGFGPFPASPDNPAGLAVQRLRAEDWAPHGASAAYALLPTVWAEAAATALASACAVGCDGVLLVGVAIGAPAFRVETRARNFAEPCRPDAEGQLWTQGAIEPDGPDARRHRARRGHARGHRESEPAGDPVGRRRRLPVQLHPLPRARRGLPCGFLHTPEVDADISLDDIVRAVQAAADAFVRHLR